MKDIPYKHCRYVLLCDDGLYYVKFLTVHSCKQHYAK
jgi:hypothetical protein